ncbi:MAG TPA: hydroxymethylbilane synthase [Rhodospirillaceae bacterium]|nr:hydroxymethylbilane synthase [Rhodospirillaceae bacterium]
MIDIPLRIGTRGSPLALYQANLVRDLLCAAWPDRPSPEIVVIRTAGDMVTDRPLSEIGGKGLFTKEIDKAQLDGEIDIAVHSAKDLETRLADGIVIGATLTREDARDALVGAPSIAEIPAGGRVGTASVRRRAQLLAVRPDLETVLIRGNVGTRLQKIADGAADATFLAYAGLRRLGRAGAADAVLAVDEMLPAVGQGIIAANCRIGDEGVAIVLQAISDPVTMACLRAERAMLDALGGTCHTPIAGLARLDGDILNLSGLAAWPDGQGLVRLAHSGPAADPKALGAHVGHELRTQMGHEFFEVIGG